MDTLNGFALEQCLEILRSPHFRGTVSFSSHLHSLRLHILSPPQQLQIIRHPDDPMPPSRATIKKSRDDLRILIDNIRTQVWYLSDPYTYGAVNRAHADFVGLRPEDMAYRKISEFFELDVSDLCISCNRQIFESGTVLATEEWATDFSGSRRLLSIYKAPVFDSDGSVGYVVCSAEDITDQRATEDALRKSEARFRLITENTRDVVWILDVESMRLVYLSPSVQQLRGFTTEEILAIPFASAIPESSRGYVLNAIRQGVADFRSGKLPPGYINRLEYQLPHKDGYLIWVEALCNFEINDTNNRLELRGVTRDISERKQAEEALRESEARFRITTEKTGDLLWVLDVESMRIIYLSESMRQFRGFTPEEAMALPLEQTILWPSVDELFDVVRRAAQDYITGAEPPDKLYTFELLLPHKDGSTIWSEEICSFYINEKSGRLELVGVGRNITKRKKEEEKLAKAMLAAESAKIKYSVEQQERAKLSRDLHDGISQTLQGTKLQLKILERKYALNTPLARDLSSLSLELELAGEEFRNLSHSMRPACLEEQTLQEALEKLSLCFRQRGISIECDMTSSLLQEIPIHIQDHIFRIAQEALANAVRHAKASIIRLHLQNGDGRLILQVSDNGSGFNIEAAFLGVCGLKIMRERAELISGTINIASESSGTRITLEVPLNDKNTDCR